MDLYLGRDGKQSGPFSEAQVRDMLGAGEATLSDLCWHEGLAEWVPLGRVLGSLGPKLPQQSEPVAVVERPATVATGTHPGFFLRVAAYLIDSIVTYALAMVASYAVTMSIVYSESTGPFDLSFLGPIAGIAASWIYFAWMESSPRQATFGKLACNFHVTDLEGRRITFARASVRYFGIFVSWFLLGIGFLFCLWSERRQCLHDMIAGCVMINGAPGRARATNARLPPSAVR